MANACARSFLYVSCSICVLGDNLTEQGCGIETSAGLQGFDKYGVWACDAVPVPKLQEALNLKAWDTLFA